MFHFNPNYGNSALLDLYPLKWKISVRSTIFAVNSNFLEFSVHKICYETVSSTFANFAQKIECNIGMRSP